ncbi:MAG: tetratricopeptide repeat protein [Bacteroidota bacterium]
MRRQGKIFEKNPQAPFQHILSEYPVNGMHPSFSHLYLSSMLPYRLTAIAVICTFISYNAGAQDATILYEEGLKLKEQKKPAEALEKFKKAVSIKPDYTAALYEAGWCHNDMKEYSKAIIALRQARTGWPTIPKVFFELGYAFEKTNQTDSAVSLYNKCLELKPDYSLALKQLGYIFYGKEDYTGALEKFKKYEEAARTTIADYLYWYRKGFSHNAIKEYSNAKLALSKSLEFKTDYSSTYLELGFASSRLKQDEEAIGYYKKAAEIDPKSHIPTNGIAEVYRDNKRDMNEAMNWYRKTLALNPTERKACFGMGYCLNSQQKYNEAIPYLRTAIEKEPTYTAAYVELGYSLYKTQSLTEAEEKLKKAISLNPKNENARYYLTLMYIGQKSRAKAQKMVDELKELSSRHVESLQAKVDAL